EPMTGHYLLGSYRGFNPLLMRFNSPDSFSPFGSGGLNAYAYCAGDPVNRRDPSGHSFWSSILKGLGLAGKSSLSRANLQADMRKSAAFLNAFTMRLAETPATTTLLRNYRVYSPTISTFERAMFGGKVELNISGHGLPGYIEDGSNMKKAADFVEEFTAQPGIISPETARIRLLLCHGADPAPDGSASLGQRLHDATGIPVKAYQGVLNARTDSVPKQRIPFNIEPNKQAPNYKPMTFTSSSKTNREVRKA
ncbi:RHS repeat-associated core domain-containing protein, partial [Pseudomonas sp. SDI]|uniref:RHS repeat-associated core domain-containing protein n=1 Tax=Pseudomonas sp. SDI TaxID=2170734 RepID=UPI00273C82AB